MEKHLRSAGNRAIIIRGNNKRGACVAGCKEGGGPSARSRAGQPAFVGKECKFCGKLRLVTSLLFLSKGLDTIWKKQP